MPRETLKEFIDRNHPVESQRRIKEQSDILLEEVDNVDMWLCKPSLRTHDNLPNQIRLMINVMCECENPQSVENKCSYITGFIGGLLYAGLIGDFEHQDYESDITDAFVETLDRIDETYRSERYELE